jgi:hypothetical protein
MKNTLVIAYNGGAYGTYLEWVLNTLISRNNIAEPFTKLGNSHKSELGHMLLDMDGFRKYAISSNTFPTARLHPKTTQFDNIKCNLNEILTHADRLILIYPDRSQQLMCVCNYMTKIWEGHYYEGGMSYTNPKDILDNYPLPPDTDIKNIPLWIMREHMSYSLFSSWEDQVEWYLPDSWNHPNAMLVTTKDLLLNFKLTIEKIVDFWGHTCVRPIDDLTPYHEKMLSLQQHLKKDLLCDNIIKSVLEKNSFLQWDDLCLISQAWIQHQLRIQGYKLKCHDLNKFPENTDQLRSLIYSK